MRFSIYLDSNYLVRAILIEQGTSSGGSILQKKSLCLQERAMLSREVSRKSKKFSFVKTA